MFDLMTKQGNISDKEHEAMQNEIMRILSNSLKYLHELSLAGTPMPIRRNTAARQQSV